MAARFSGGTNIRSLQGFNSIYELKYFSFFLKRMKSDAPALKTFKKTGSF